ncbi:Delta(24)-sterol [Castilleja foliolosa]|uniref:Delta(24)-sterol n=1 Tax=Castilleja foliolosa TaxID=1961234 RepID=A0ABD3ELK6_9LAMI
MKIMIYLEPEFELQRRQGDAQYAQMYTNVGVYYAPETILRGEVFDGAGAVKNLESWLIENHGFQPQYSVSELDEKNFWRMFDARLYEHCRRKYGVVGVRISHIACEMILQTIYKLDNLLPLTRPFKGMMAQLIWYQSRPKLMMGGPVDVIPASPKRLRRSRFPRAEPRPAREREC